MAVELLLDGPEDAAVSILLAHGAGAPMDSPFMAKAARGLASRGARVGRFEFPYMAARRNGGRSGAPDREPVLRESWKAAIAAFGRGTAIVIGGKSLGGRIASLVADEVSARGLICFGYPFHPPGRPEKLRTAHLEGLRTPALILQGARDPFGTGDDVAGYRLSPSIRIHWLPDGDHSFKPRARSGKTEADNVEEAIAKAWEFCESIVGSR